MKANAQVTYGNANSLVLRDIDESVQDTCGSRYAQTAMGGTR